MSTAALFTVTWIWQQPNVSIHREVVQNIIQCEKKNLAFGTTWMNLEGIMVYEINQT